MVLPGRCLIKKNFYKVMCRKDEVKMASKDWKLPDAQHKITEEKGLDIENEKHSLSVQARMAAQESFALTFEEMDR